MPKLLVRSFGMEFGFERTGAWIRGRNMFGPVRGPWPDDSWKGVAGERAAHVLLRKRP